MKAYLKHYRQSPRKVRLVASLLKGKDVERARVLLDMMTKRAAGPLKKLLDSAIANATEGGKLEKKRDLYVKEFRVDNGVTLKRQMPRARGAAFPINKRTSNISLVLEERPEMNNKQETANKKK